MQSANRIHSDGSVVTSDPSMVPAAPANLKLWQRAGGTSRVKLRGESANETSTQVYETSDTLLTLLTGESLVQTAFYF